MKARTRPWDYRDAIATTVTRRGFLAGAAAATLAAGGLGSLIAAGGSGSINTKLLSQALPARPYHPVSWPIRQSNLPIPGGQLAEQDVTLQVYCLPGRVAQRCLDDFARKYNCRSNTSRSWLPRLSYVLSVRATRVKGLRYGKNKTCQQ